MSTNKKKYTGIHYHAPSGTWRVFTKEDYRGYYLGSIPDKLEAAIFYDMVVIILRRDKKFRNFPDKKYSTKSLAVVRGRVEERFETVERRSVRTSRGYRVAKSRYTGVTFCSKTRKWKSSILYKGRKRVLGYYRLAEEAAKCYDVFRRVLYRTKRELNFPWYTYSADELKVAKNTSKQLTM